MRDRQGCTYDCEAGCTDGFSDWIEPSGDIAVCSRCRRLRLGHFSVSPREALKLLDSGENSSKCGLHFRGGLSRRRSRVRAPSAPPLTLTKTPDISGVLLFSLPFPIHLPRISVRGLSEVFLNTGADSKGLRFGFPAFHTDDRFVS